MPGELRVPGSLKRSPARTERHLGSLQDTIRRWRILLTLGWLLALWAVTLGRVPESAPLGPEPFVLCLICGERGGADLLLNLLFFMPLGLALARRVGVGGATLIGAAVSGGVEVAQLYIPGRFSTLADLLSNTTGAFLGAALHTGLARMAGGRSPGPGTTAAFAVAAAAIVALGGWLVAPAPTSEAYFGQWTPAFGTRYRGEVLTARFDDHPFPNGRIPERRNAQEAMRRDWSLSGVVRKGPPPRAVSSVLSIYDGRQAEILYLGAYGEHLLLRERLRAQDWRLDRPELVWWAALAPVAVGDTVALEARREGHDRCLAVDGTERCGLGFTPGRLWSLLLYPSSAPRGLQRLADLGLVFVLFFPVGLCARSWGVAVVGGAAGALGVAAAVVSTRLVVDPFLEPASALAGLAVGQTVAIFLRGSVGALLFWSTPGPSTPASPGSP